MVRSIDRSHAPELLRMIKMHERPRTDPHLHTPTTKLGWVSQAGKHALKQSSRASGLGLVVVGERERARRSAGWREKTHSIPSNCDAKWKGASPAAGGRSHSHFASPCARLEPFGRRPVEQRHSLPPASFSSFPLA